jgi:nucleoside-diphosphate-sugar epimerase
MHSKFILITGANGFIGSAICKALHQTNAVRAVVRGPVPPRLIDGVEYFSGSLSHDFEWGESLRDVSQIIHCAARVHVMNDKSLNPLAEFRRVNVEGTMRLARQAAKSGVKRFIYLSSIKVNGEFSRIDAPFEPDQKPSPVDPYGVSKNEAEQGLISLSSETGMEVVIIRPPLVYGPGVQANFRSMMIWLKRGLPLPFGAITNNRRSLIYLDNLVDLVVTCTKHPAAVNQIFLASDYHDLSTAELLNRLAMSLGRPAKLINVPLDLLTLGAKIVGGADLVDRLCGSLQVDISKTIDLLEWRPPVGLDEGFELTARCFMRNYD